MTRRQLSQASEWLRTAVMDNPEGLLLLAAGGVLLMRRSGAVGGSVGFPKGTGARSGRTSETLLDQAASVSESIASSTIGLRARGSTSRE